MLLKLNVVLHLELSSQRNDRRPTCRCVNVSHCLRNTVLKWFVEVRLRDPQCFGRVEGSELCKFMMLFLSSSMETGLCMANICS